MAEFISLEASGLSDEFDASVHGEKPVVNVEEQEDTIVISYIFPGFTVADDDQEVGGKRLPFKEIGISGAGFVSESGRPLLPSFGRFVQIPWHCDYEVSVKRSKAVEIPGILVTPAQEEATDSGESEYEYDEEAYAADTLYPAETVAVSEPQAMDDYRVLTIHVRPLQYNAAKQLLIGYSNITITIKLTAKAETDATEVDVSPFPDPTLNREGFGNLLLNPARGIATRLPSVPAPPVAIPSFPRGPEFIIIYDEALRQPAEALAKWKNMKGLRTDTVSIDTVGNSPQQIKDYIRKQRRLVMSRLRYVLLFGDVGKIVTENAGGTTTDHYYFTPKDPVNESECILPWISGGRIPVRTARDGQCVVDQIIRYERDPSGDPEYYRRMTFAAYFQDDPPQDGKANRAYMLTMEKIRQHMISQDFDVERVYVSNNPNVQTYKDGSPVPSEVRQSIVDGAAATDMLLSAATEGQLAIGHRDHGDTDGWSHPSFTDNHVRSILSQQPSIFFSINCLTGQFDANPRDSFAEAILALDGGAPSLIAATEVSGTWRNDSLMKALFDAMWPGVIPAFPGTTASYAIRHNRLGDILNYAKSYLLVAHGTGAGVKDHFEMYHVIGDPTLQLWADAPQTVSVRASIPWDKLLINLSSCPSDAIITIWYRGELLKRLAARSTRISISLRDLNLRASLPPFWPMRRVLSVCFSAPGCRFVEVKPLF